MIRGKRPLLPNSEQSRAIWDIPRRLMNDGFRDVLKLYPAATVNYVWNEPVVVYYDHVLTNEEVNLIAETVQERFKRSMVVDETGTPQIDTGRTSDTAWIYLTEAPRFNVIVNKLAALSGFTAKSAGHIRVNRWRAGQYFNPQHHFLQEEQLRALNSRYVNGLVPFSFI